MRRGPGPQRVAADPAISAFVTANAGSGKTKTLIDRVARLLLQDRRRCSASPTQGRRRRDAAAAV